MRHRLVLLIIIPIFFLTILPTTGTPLGLHMEVSENIITTDTLSIHLFDLPPYQSYYLNWTGHEALWEFEYSPQNISYGADIDVDFTVPTDELYMNFYLWSGEDGSYLDEISLVVSVDYNPKGNPVDLLGWFDPDMIIPLAIGSILFMVSYTVFWFLRRGH